MIMDEHQAAEWVDRLAGIGVYFDIHDGMLLVSTPSGKVTSGMRHLILQNQQVIKEVVLARQGVNRGHIDFLRWMIEQGKLTEEITPDDEITSD